MTKKLTAPQIEALRNASRYEWRIGAGFDCGWAKPVTMRALAKLGFVKIEFDRDTSRGETHALVFGVVTDAGRAALAAADAD